jgi:uncharacterized protein YjbI with pentapeptide repeats
VAAREQRHHAGSQRADLRGAKLRDADLRRADLSMAILGGTNLFRWIDLRGTDPNGADLRGADLSMANLIGTDLTGADVFEVFLFETVFSDTNLTAVRDLEICIHDGPSTLDHRTLAKSGPLPREFKRLIGQAGIKTIKFHGLRHTCATLRLQAGVPVHVVQERLGHQRIEVTLGIYAHVLPVMQQDAASKLAALLQALKNGAAIAAPTPLVTYS